MNDLTKVFGEHYVWAPLSLLGFEEVSNWVLHHLSVSLEEEVFLQASVIIILHWWTLRAIAKLSIQLMLEDVRAWSALLETSLLGTQKIPLYSSMVL